MNPRFAYPVVVALLAIGALLVVARSSRSGGAATVNGARDNRSMHSGAARATQLADREDSQLQGGSAASNKRSVTRAPAFDASESERSLDVVVVAPPADPLNLDVVVIVERNDLPADLVELEGASKRYSTWIEVSRCGDTFGETLQLDLPTAFQTRLRLEAPSASMKPRIATKLDSTNAPVELITEAGPTVTLELVSRTLDAGDLAMFDGATLKLNPLRVSGGVDAVNPDASVIVATFDAQGRAQLPSSPRGVVLLPIDRGIRGDDGRAAVLRWTGSRLRERGAQIIAVEIAPARRVGVLAVREDTGQILGHMGVTLVHASGEIIESVGRAENGGSEFIVTDPSDLEVVARKEGFKTTRVPLSRNEDLVQVSLAPLGETTGRVVDVFGAPARGLALGELVRRQRVSLIVTHPVITDDEGRYRFARFERRPISLDVLRPRDGTAVDWNRYMGRDWSGYRLLPNAVNLGEANSDLVLAKTFDVVGTVRTADGKLLERGIVHLKWPREGDAKLRGVREFKTSAKLAQGGFQLTDVVAGRWIATIQSDGRAEEPLAVDVSEGNALDISLTSRADTGPVTVRGTLVDASGRGVRGTFAWRDGLNRAGGGSCDTQGRFSLAVAASTKLLIWCGPSDPATATAYAVASWSGVVDAPSGTLDLPPMVLALCGSVVVTVAGNRGGAYLGCKVDLVTRDFEVPYTTQKLRHPATTLGSVAAGHYLVVVRAASGEVIATGPVEVHSGETSLVNLTVQPR